MPLSTVNRDEYGEKRGERFQTNRPRTSDLWKVKIKKEEKFKNPICRATEKSIHQPSTEMTIHTDKANAMRRKSPKNQISSKAKAELFRSQVHGPSLSLK